MNACYLKTIKLFSNVYKRTLSNKAYLSDPTSLKSKYDVIIIGGGHNGLVAANYLAKMGNGKLKICVLERRHLVGGAAVTEEIIPGFKFSRASYVFSLFRPIIIKELDLLRHGLLKFYIRDPYAYTPLLESDPQYRPNARSLTLGLNTQKSLQEIEKFSKRDAQVYCKYENLMHSICQLIDKYIDQVPPDMRILNSKGNYRKKLELLKFYLADFKSIKFIINNYNEIYRLFTAPSAHILNEWFESDVLKATLATDSIVGAFLSPYTDGSAYVLLHHVMGGVDGKRGAWAFVEGGMGSVSECLAHNAKSYGDQVEIYVSQEVSQIQLQKQNSDHKMKTNGVLLKNGKFIEADYVLSNCTPHVTFNKMLDSYKLQNSQDEETEKFFRRVKDIKYDSGVVKINVAVSKMLNFKASPNKENEIMPHHQASIYLNCNSMDTLHQAYVDAKHHNCQTKRPIVEMVIPSSLDPTMAPKGAHVLSMFCQHFPVNNNKESHEKLKEAFVNTVFDSLELYAPGFKDSVIGKDWLTPVDLENVFGLTGGNIFHGAMSLNQLFINRPVSGWATYNTPIKGLYLAGSGTHPGGGVMGSSGRLAALECFKELSTK